MSLRFFLGISTILLALLTVAQCAATAPPEDLQALIRSAKASPQGKALVARSLAQNPAPSNFELAGIRVELKKILAREVSATVAPQAAPPQPATPAALASPEPSALSHVALKFILIGSVILLGVKALFALGRPRGPY